MQHPSPHVLTLSAKRPSASALSSLLLAVLAALSLAACGGGGGGSDTTSSSASSSASSFSVPSEPVGLGSVDTAVAPSGVVAYVDDGATNVRGDACHATVDTNAGVRVLRGFLDLWTPRSLFVDAGQTAAASGSCAAVVASDWSGVPGSATDGTIKNATIHNANVNYVATVTASRTSDQELAAYLDDRRGKGYSVSDGMGPLTTAWRAGSKQTTTITAIPADAGTVLYNDGGNNVGVTTASGNTDMGLAVDFISGLADASTEPAKRYYKYARPWRWSSSVIVAPSLVPAKSSTPATDGGFLSGHAAEAWRDSLAMAYLVPQRYQEMITRAMEMGENRILAGMHSPLDVIGGRIQSLAVMAYNLNKASAATLKSTAYAQTQSWLQTQVGVSTPAALNTYAHSASIGADRFADAATNKTNFVNRLTYSFPQIASASAAPIVPKGAEALLETRQPYLSADQRRVVLKTTEIASGYPVMDDQEGWGRLNLYAAADGYGAFNGDVSVSMDASLGGFNALDSWKNDIAGAGKLSKSGTGVLRLSGANTYSGGTVIAAGTLAADSTNAFGTGDVFMKGGALECTAPGALAILGAYTQTAGSLNLVMRAATKGVLKVTGTATLAGGSLAISFAGGYTPAIGDTLTVITAGQRNGSFSSVSVAGFSDIVTTYTSTGVTVRIRG